MHAKARQTGRRAIPDHPHDPCHGWPFLLACLPSLPSTPPSAFSCWRPRPRQAPDRHLENLCNGGQGGVRGFFLATASTAQLKPYSGRAISERHARRSRPASSSWRLAARPPPPSHLLPRLVPKAVAASRFAGPVGHACEAPARNATLPPPSQAQAGFAPGRGGVGYYLLLDVPMARPVV